MSKSSPTRPCLSSQKGSPNSPQWRERRQHPITANQKPWPPVRRSKLAEADSGRLWRFSSFWVMLLALGESFDRVTKKAGKPLYPRYIKERIVLETVFFCLVFLQPTCRHTFIFGLHLFVGSMQCYCSVLDYARKSKRETDKENSFNFVLHFWVFLFQTGCWPSSFRSKKIWKSFVVAQ